ncbi:uncharacterized protein CANTADRAFT_7008 [Suhomyces tanzawaensis NRRL Y-17324]|uniref:Uncharacterized protein n=1 Tax=Suhomyces tanzawaensis NRRL Y-17324 TaxID=984487 RepID=A0A1E4SGL6_9ASCO|nr:uncharacterized protein CANTADRAFT_7008 [Suhomyces tanzawaensis NRRL Y-17324]ODV78657.1 hypothetical protein CANTADRAFT_7008 [Suhomyces tanzawaensis NRRL Y-17324]
MAEPHVDIFEHLDVGIGELLYNRHADELLGNNDPREQLRRLERLNQLIQERRRQEAARLFRSYWGVVYVGDYVPLPTFQYGRFWTEYVPQMRRATMQSFVTAVELMIRMMRIMLFVTTLSVYLQHAFGFFKIISFGNNFIYETISYVYQDSPAFINRCVLMRRHGMDITLVLLNEYADSLAWALLVEIPELMIALAIQLACHYPEGEPVTCQVLGTGLLFRFSNVLEQYFVSLKSMPRWYLKLLSLVVFYAFLIARAVVCLNVCLFFFINLLKRLNKYGLFVVRMAEACVVALEYIM